MARSSPGTQRVLSILNLLAEHGEVPFSLTDIIKALKINRSTCHSILAELVDADYLYRTNDKLYVLGPAAARIGQAARSQVSPLQVAQPEMRALADEHDVICTAIFRDRNDVIYRAQAASVSHLGGSLPRGTRLPLRPSFGSIFWAWAPAEEAEAWLDQISPAPTPTERAAMAKGMEFVLEHGYQFVIRKTAETSVASTTEWLFAEDERDRPVQLGLSLAKDESYRLASVSAPVFDERGRVAFTLALTGFNKTCTGAEIAAIGNQVRQACSRVSRFTAGTGAPVKLVV